MAISLLTATASSISDTLDTDGLVTQINTTLSALLDVRVMGVSFAARSEERVIGNELQATLTYDLSGAVMGAPFVAIAFQDKTPAAVKAAVDAFVAAHPGYFFSTVWIEPVASARRGVQYVGLLFYNVSASEGAANWIVNGAPVTVPTGNTLWVDSVNGDNATGRRGDEVKPFLTIQAAITAASAGDAVVVRTGTYTLTTAIILQPSVFLHFMPETFVNGANNTVAFTDNGVAINTRISGDAVLNAGVGGGLLSLTGNSSVLSIECVEVYGPSLAFSGALQFGGAGNQSLTLVAKRDITCNGGGQPFSLVGVTGVTLSITSPIISADSFLRLTAGAPVVRVVAGKITTGNYVIQSENASPVVFVQSDTVTTGGPVLNFQGTGTPRVDLDVGTFVISGMVRSLVTSSYVRVRAMEITSDANNNLIFLNNAGSQSIAIECVGDILATTAAIYNSFGDNYYVIKAKNLAISSGNPVVAVVDGNPNVVLDITESLSGATIVTATAGLDTLHFDIRAMEIFGTDQVIRIDVGVVTGVMVASRRIVGGMIVRDFGSTGATNVSVKAQTITANNTGAFGWDIDHAAAARYDIEAEALVAVVRMNAASSELHLRAQTHTGHIPTSATLYGIAGKVFARWDECTADAATTDGVIGLNLTGVVHVLSGRIIGPDVAGGKAAVFFTDTSSLVLYPGAVLIAGASAASSIGIAGAAATPTVLAMGAIAANKAVEAGVIVAVGSLLVDPLVV